MTTFISLGSEIRRLSFLLCIFFMTGLVLHAQDKTQYFIEIKEGYELGTITKTVNADSTLTLSISNQSLATVLNTKQLTEFKLAFPGLQRARLQRVYLIEVPFETDIGDISTRVEVSNIELVPDEEPMLMDEPAPSFTILPNDYSDIVIGGRNQDLDLIRAPLAWTIATGENVIVGVSDAKIHVDHEDLGNNILILPNSPTSGTHGTGVVSKIAALTNNGLGVASLAYNSDIISWNYVTLYEGILELAQIPGVRVINCSWRLCSYNSYYDEMFSAIQEELGVLIVAAAGNGSPGCPPDGHGYGYPGAFDAPMSVSGVGSKLFIGEFHNWLNPDGNLWWELSWRDCHGKRPPNPIEQGGSLTHNDKVDVCAPGYLVTTLTSLPDYPSGYRLGNGTSGSTPFVSALAALIFSINPNFTPQEVKSIIKNTADDIYYIPYNQDYLGELGTGRINAFRAVKTADCITNPTSGLDLGMQDSLEDYFFEPNENTPVFWNSPDIWVRNQNEGILIPKHENPEYTAGQDNYAYVRVTNNSCDVNSGTEKVNLYWAKASTSLDWPDPWDGSVSVGGVVFGGEVGEMDIPALSPGESTIIEIPWQVPNPADYNNITNNPWHFCLLARINTTSDPIIATTGELLSESILNNNNIVMKNLTVVDIDPDSPTPAPIGGMIHVSNPSTLAKTYTLSLFPEANEPGKALYEEAEVTITLDETLYDAWDNGGKEMQESQEIRPRRIQATGGNATLSNITLQPGEWGTAYVSFHFLTEELTSKQSFTYHLAQIDEFDDTTIGGETFLVNKQYRDSFYADAGSDDEVDINDSITLSAGTISEEAVYNWYDPEGNLIHTGTTLTITPQITKTYQLEVVADIDGFKDYDEVTVTVNPYRIESLTPNPTSDLVTVNYVIAGATNAYLMVVNTQTGSSENIILDLTTTSINLDVTHLSTGLYNIILLCDGDIQNSKTLLKN